MKISFQPDCCPTTVAIYFEGAERCVSANNNNNNNNNNIHCLLQQGACYDVKGSRAKSRFQKTDFLKLNIEGPRLQSVDFDGWYGSTPKGNHVRCTGPRFAKLTKVAKNSKTT